MEVFDVHELPWRLLEHILTYDDKIHSLLWIIGFDTNIEVIVVSLTTSEAHHALWWASQVVNKTTMTEIEVSISILSWWNQINNE